MSISTTPTIKSLIHPNQKSLKPIWLDSQTKYVTQSLLGISVYSHTIMLWYLSATYTELARWSLALRSLLYLLEGKTSHSHLLSITLLLLTTTTIITTIIITSTTITLTQRRRGLSCLYLTRRQLDLEIVEIRMMMKLMNRDKELKKFSPGRMRMTVMLSQEFFPNLSTVFVQQVSNRSSHTFSKQIPNLIFHNVPTDASVYFSAFVVINVFNPSASTPSSHPGSGVLVHIPWPTSNQPEKKPS